MNNIYLPKGSIINQYVIERHLASGGFGNTYLAHNQEGNQVVIKEFFLKGVCDRSIDSRNVTISIDSNKPLFASQKAKFIKEANRLKSLSHPNVVKVTDIIEANETAYYVMNYIDGKSLAQMEKPFSEIKVRHYLDQLMNALEYVHSQGLLHLDIKPSNIMIDRDGNAILIDFGASKLYDAEGANHSILTTTTGISYTPGYAPLEQISNHLDALGTHSDIYALGATMYNLLTNEKPPQPLVIQENGLPQIPNITPSLMTAIDGAMTYLRKDRIKNIAELRTVVDNEQTVPMSPPPSVSSYRQDTIPHNSRPRLIQQPAVDSKKTKSKTTIESTNSNKPLWIAGSVILALTLLIVVISSNKKDNSAEYSNLVDTCVADVAQDTTPKASDPAPVVAPSESGDITTTETAEPEELKTTPDLTFFELKGPVKKVSCNYYEPKVGYKKSYSFDEEGNLITPNGIKISRSNGNIKTVKYYDDITGQWLSETFSVNSGGRVTCQSGVGPDGGGDSYYNYDSDDKLTSITHYYSIEGESEKSSQKFKYKKFDDYGNWTKRVATHYIEGYEHESYTETRTITYY